MSEKTSIEWCDSTWNPWEGRQKVGPGCDHCYAETRNARFAGGSAVNWGPGAPRRRTSAANWRKPLAWNAAHEQFFAAHGRRQRVFCASLADVFDNAVNPMWRVDLFDLISNTPNLDWLLLTKRIGNAREMISGALGSIMRDEREWPWPNVWLGATIVNQAEADRDIPKLLEVPARVRFLSMEPLLGPVDLRFHIYSEPTGNFRTHGGKRQLELRRPADGGLHWVIAGGESGPGARPMHPDWARSLRDQCAAASVPFLFKQWGEWCEPVDGERYDTTMGRAQRVPAFIVSKTGTVHCFENDQTRDGGRTMLRVGKRAAGRLLDSRAHDEFPEVQ
ncbi:phage Gp37/Gp68 family protein [Burkholderia thailandensis]|uniref:phage Gp37/Gp68 family protein n=1 Tax=Burkholderia thailandensis TaxID=57975 RepID=UPI00217CEB28|nr:phage Gp37/Gp68 family protein [Burkholderia thailandensis]MCS6516927.1 phage Gp37/Gp68 family protein [Burkholderia thailandensis]